MSKPIQNHIEDEVVALFLESVSQRYDHPLSELTPLWEAIKKGEKLPSLDGNAVVCTEKMASGKNKGQLCGKKLKNGKCPTHSKNKKAKKEKKDDEDEEELVPIEENDEEELKPSESV